MRSAQNRDDACAELAAAQHGLLSRSQVTDVGMSRQARHRRLETGRWQEVLPGVYRVAGAPATNDQSLMAACIWAGPGAAGSHRAAAALWGLLDDQAAPVEITTPRRLRHSGVVVHRVPLGARHVTRIGTIPVTRPARTLLDLGAVASVRTVEHALDDALVRGLVTIRGLQRMLRSEGGPGRGGAGVLRQLVCVRDPLLAPPESVLESRIARLLRRSDLPQPVPQFQVRVGGRLVARIDFAWPEAMVAVEADGYRHHGTRTAWRRDLKRRNALTTLGWYVIHVPWHEVSERPEAVISAIRTALGPPSDALRTSEPG